MEWKEEEFRDIIAGGIDLSFDCMTNNNENTYVRNTKRKTQRLVNLLMKYYQRYEGKWDHELFSNLIEQSGFTKK